MLMLFRASIENSFTFFPKCDARILAFVSSECTLPTDLVLPCRDAVIFSLASAVEGARTCKAWRISASYFTRNARAEEEEEAAAEVNEDTRVMLIPPPPPTPIPPPSPPPPPPDDDTDRPPCRLLVFVLLAAPW